MDNEVEGTAVGEPGPRRRKPWGGRFQEDQAPLFERLNAGAALECPEYIKDALNWLSAELKVTAGETP